MKRTDGEWPEEIDMLSGLSRWGWTLYGLGERHQPAAIAAVQRFARVADVIVVRGHDRAAAYRTITSGTVDPLRADEVIWAYIGAPAPTIRAMLNLRLDVECGPPLPIPAACRVPEIDRRPLTIIPPR